MKNVASNQSETSESSGVHDVPRDDGAPSGIAERYANADLSPIRIYGVREDGACTCSEGAACDKPGKHPVGNGWQHAPINARKVDAHLARGGNVGLRMGEQPDGTLLVALDEDEPGALERAEAELGALPDTLQSRSGSGCGGHRVFTWPATEPLPKNRVKVLPGIDVRAQGGQIVVEPSRHYSGGTYEWIRTDGVTELPEAWRAALLAGGTPGTKTSTPAVVASSRAARVAGVLLPLVAERGQRHAVSRAAGGYLARYELGPWSDEEIAACVRLLPSDSTEARVEGARACAARARAGEAAPGWTDLKSWLGDEDAERLALAARSEWWVRTWHVWTRVPDADAPADEPADSELPDLVGDARGSQFWFRIANAGNAYFSPVAKGMLPARAREAGHEAGKAETIAAHATIAERVVRDFSARGIEWRGDERAMIQGYEPPVIVPAYDAAADAWFRALAGDRYGLLAQWFGACAQEHVGKLTACLILIGDTGIGKTLSGIVAARMWGASSPVSLADAIDKFNVRITTSPIVLDDEAARMKQGDVSTAAFREMLSARERTYEPKGVDKRDLRGCQRFIVTCNAFSDLRFSDVGAAAVVEALADRLLVIRVVRGEQTAHVREALNALRLPDTDDVDLDRLDRHVAWIVSETRITPQRFLASPGKNDRAAHEAILASIVERYAELFALVREAIEHGETSAVGNQHGPAVFVHGGIVWVRAAQAGERERLPAHEVHRALAAWELEPRREWVKVGGESVRARAYRLDALRAVLGM